jgi:DNA-binding XRE family transcriptional regulator
MNSVKFKELREKLNISYSCLARLTGEEEDSIILWEKEDAIPDELITLVSELYQNLKIVIDHFLEKINTIKHDENRIIQLVYNKDDDFFFAEPELARKLRSHEVHKIFIEKASAECDNNHISMEIVFFIRNNYLNWLKENDVNHCCTYLHEWASSKNNYPIKLGQYNLIQNYLDNSHKMLKCLEEKLHTYLPFDEWNIHTKISAIKTSLLHSIVDLAKETLLDYENNKLIKSAIVARAAFEREIVLYSLYLLVKESIDNEAPINERDLNKLIGSRGEFAVVPATNIITLRDHQIKNEFPDVEREMVNIYDALSNLAHPNYEGVLDAYMNVEQDKKKLNFGLHDKGNIGLAVLAGINKALTLAKVWDDYLTELLVELHKVNEPQ